MSTLQKWLQMKEGHINSRQYENSILPKYVSSIELSQHERFERVHVSGINTLDLDQIENR